MKKKVARKTAKKSPALHAKSQMDQLSSGAGNIDQIRDIIFGAQMQDFDSHFSVIEDEIRKSTKITQQSIDDVKKNLSKELRTTSAMLENKIKSVSSVGDQNNNNLKKQLDATEKKLVNSIDALSKRLSDNTKMLESNLAKTNNNLRAELQKLDSALTADIQAKHTALTADIQAKSSALKADLKAKHSELQEDKVSRDELAEILFELGMRIKGTNLVPALIKKTSK